MKKVIALFVIGIIISFTPEKEYSVKYTIPQWESKLQLVGQAVNAIKNSDLPTKYSLPLMDSLLAFQNEIKNQIVPQLDTTKKK